MAARLFKPLEGSQTRGVTCLRAEWTFNGSGGVTTSSDQQQDGIFVGTTYNDGDGSGGSQAIYLGRFDSQPYAPAELNPATHQNDFYADILGIDMTFKSDSDPVVSERVGFQITASHVAALITGTGNIYTDSYAPVFAVKYFSLDDGTAATAADLAGTTVHMALWLKNSGD